jgi:hypothetical protein
LNTGIIGMTVELVDDSWIDSVGGLSRWYILRTPPLFWADADPLDSQRDAARAPHNNIGRMNISFPERAACFRQMELRRRCGDILHCSSVRDRFKSPLHRKRGSLDETSKSAGS